MSDLFSETALVVPFELLRMTDVESVGGKNASLGEMISQLPSGVRVPTGFATTAHAFRQFLAFAGLTERINARLDALDTEDVRALAAAGAEIRAMVEAQPFPVDFEKAIREEFVRLQGSNPESSFAVRSSATAEDLPDASFAGQQETFLNVVGIDDVLHKMKEVFASLYNDRAISYRVHKGFAHADVALSAGVQRMVRSDLGAAGVMFTIDTESGFEDVVFITSSYGLGETVVQGSVNPDEWLIFKPTLAQGFRPILSRRLGSKAIRLVRADPPEAGRPVRIEAVEPADCQRFALSDEEVLTLARWAVTIEAHYSALRGTPTPMDIEWAKDGPDGELYILQARPETVESRRSGAVLRSWHLEPHQASPIVSGQAIGASVSSGVVRLIRDPAAMEHFQQGDVLVTGRTDPDWEPILRMASGVVTDQGGRTCHAAIIARELGVPAIVGCEDATEVVKDGEDLTASCCEGDTGFVYQGKVPFEVVTVALDNMPAIPVKIAMNVGNPQLAFDFAQLPNDGVGLARLEFIISNTIGIHPKACLDYAKLPDELRAEVANAARGYASPKEFYVKKLAEGVSTIAAAFWPKKVIVRLSDFKSNEYRNLIGGPRYEPTEENPMLGFRGASRYIAHSFRECFKLECEAMKFVRDMMGLTNVELMVPFVRTLGEADAVLAIMKDFGLERGKNGLKIVMMCEIPSNAILADEFLERFDGFSIGSNDMTQLTLALDRDSGLVMDAFDERDAAVKRMLHLAISACRKANKYVGICGQGPSDYPDLAEWLMKEGIESMSLNPDTVVETWLHLAKVK